MGRKHNKYLLALIYNVIFARAYPSSEYIITIDPRFRPVPDLPYLPDILISHDGTIELWIEIGNLQHHKAQAVQARLGNKVLCHLSYSHPIFTIGTGVEPIAKQELLNLNKYDIKTNQKKEICALPYKKKKK